MVPVNTTQDVSRSFMRNKGESGIAIILLRLTIHHYFHRHSFPFTDLVPCTVSSNLFFPYSQRSLAPNLIFFPRSHILILIINSYAFKMISWPCVFFHKSPSMLMEKKNRTIVIEANYLCHKEGWRTSTCFRLMTSKIRKSRWWSWCLYLHLQDWIYLFVGVMRLEALRCRWSV